MLLFTLLQTTVLAKIGGALGVGIIAFAAALGIARIGKSLMEAAARQPEITGKLQTSAIIICALIEGVCLFGVIVCLLAVLS